MIKAVNVVMPVSVDFNNGSSKVCFVDFVNQKTYGFDGTPMPDDENQEIMNNIRGQQEALVPDLPYEQIYEVMRTEKTLQEENSKHIFRRN